MTLLVRLFYIQISLHYCIDGLTPFRSRIEWTILLTVVLVMYTHDTQDAMTNDRKLTLQKHLISNTILIIARIVRTYVRKRRAR